MMLTLSQPIRPVAPRRKESKPEGRPGFANSISRLPLAAAALTLCETMATAEKLHEVLVIDDEVQIRRLMRITLEAGGFTMRESDSGRGGLGEISFRQPDAVVLDLGLPDMSGVDVLKRLREWSQVPVLILSVLGHEDDKVSALDAGADDYLTKPFNGRELLARLRVMLRHSRPEDGISIVRFGAVEVDLSRRQVRRAGEPVPLTAKEYALLRLLVLHRNKVLTHRQLLRDVWGPTSDDQTHYLRVYVDRLRRKLEKDPKAPALLTTVLGVGYRLVCE
jgi:two-component system KDP operon response regulator KdpE